jgi:PAS domain S-box-containing protein
MAAAIRVLYVDDEPDLLEIGKLFLEESGNFTVTTTLSATNAIRLIEREKFDVIVSDYQMPGMDGIQFLVEVRQHFGTIPFILFTGRGREEVVIQALNSGADFYLQKGGEPGAQFAELSHKIKKAVEALRAEEADRASRDQLILSEANLRIHKTELEAQAEELMRAKLAVEESRDKFLDLYDFAPLGYLTLSDKALIMDMNLTGAKLLGVERGRRVKAPFSKFVAEKDADPWHWYFLNVLNQQEKRICTLMLTRGDGSAFPARLEGIRINSSDGTIAIRIAFTDISDIRHAEETLRDSEKKFRSLTESSPDYIMRYDRQCRHTYMNPAALRVSGLTEGQIIGKTHRESGFDEVQSRFWEEKITEVFETGKQYQTQFAWDRPKGRVFLDWMLTPEFSDDGTVQSVLGVSRDITRLKNAEEAMRQSEALLKRTGEIARVGGWEMDAATLVVTWTEETYHIHEVPLGQMPPLEGAIQFFHPDDQAKLSDAITRALTTGEGYDMELRFITATGKHLWTRTVCQPQFVDGKTIRLNGTFQDITGRKLAEEELLRKSEELSASYEEIAANQEELRANLDALTRQEQELLESKQELADIIEFLPDATFVIDREGIVIAWNRAIEEMTGIDKTFMIGKGDHEYAIPYYGERRRQLLDLIDADDDELQAKYKNITRKGKTLYAEVFTPALYGGKGAYVWATGSPLFDNCGNRIGAIEAIRDITAWKRTEMDLVSAQEHLKEVHRLAHIGTWDWVIKTDTVTWSEELCTISGWDPSLPAPTYAELPRIYAPASWELLNNAVTRALTTGEPYNLELELIRSDGSIRWTQAFGGVIRDGNGKVTGLHGTLQDITESKRAEAALAESFATFRTVMDSLDALVYVADMKTYEILFVNEYGRKIWGDLSGKTCWETLQVNQRGPCPFCTNNKLLDSEGNPADIVIWEFKNTINGHWYECHDSAIRWTDGRIVRIEIATDITQRKQGEEVLAESEDRFRGIFDTITSGVAIYEVLNNGASGTDYLIKDFNKTALEIEGKQKEEVVGKSLFDLRPAIDDYGLIPVFQQVWKTGVPAYIPQKVYIDEKYSSWYENRVFRLHSGEIVAVYDDVTERKRAEETLKESEFKYRSLIESSSDAIFCVDQQGTYKFTNQVFASTFNKTPEYFIGKTFWDIYPKEHADYRQSVNVKVFETGLTQTAEVEVPLPDKSLFFIAKANPIKDESGNVILNLTHATDITERKKVEAALKKSQIQLAEAMDLAHLVNWEFDVATGIFTFNDRFYALYGTTTELEGGNQMPVEMYARKFVHPDDQHLVADEVNKAIQATDPGYMSQVEHRIIRRNGEIRHIVVRFGITKDNNGRTIKTHGANQDITEIKRADELVRESENKFSSVFYCNPVALTLVSAIDGKFVNVNDTFLRDTGYTRDEVIGVTAEALGIFADRNERERLSTALRDTQMIHDIEIRCRMKSGEIRLCLFSSGLILIAGKPHILSTIRDVTEHKRAEEALKKANKKLHLLSSITRHDIRNKVSVQLGYLALAQKKVKNSPEMADFIGKLESTAKTINDQIDFTRIYQDLGIHEPQWQELHAVLMKNPAPQGILLSDTCAGIEVNADVMLEKVFGNLIDNSVNHGKRVTSIILSAEERDNNLIIRYEDDGIGIPADEKEMIFERGYGKNTGLGLFLVRDVLALTGITITETGIPGKGARFEMAVPKGAWRIAGNGV